MTASPSRPRLLDLFCGGGGASMGYWLATRRPLARCDRQTGKTHRLGYGNR